MKGLGEEERTRRGFGSGVEKTLVVHQLTVPEKESFDQRGRGKRNGWKPTAALERNRSVCGEIETVIEIRPQNTSCARRSPGC